MDKIIWEPHPRYIGILEVTKCGKVRSITRKVANGNTIKGKLRKPNKSKRGYFYISTTSGFKTRGEAVHRLVAEIFIPNPENKPQVNHKNGIKTDNRVENLEWCTNSENMIHAISNGLSKNVGVTHKYSKFSKKQVEFIYTSRIIHTELCKMFNVSMSSIHGIKSRKTYSLFNRLINNPKTSKTLTHTKS